MTKMVKMIKNLMEIRRVATMMVVIRNKVAKEDQKTIMPAETLSVNTVRKLIFHIQPYTLIWSKNTLRDQMVSLEIHQQVAEDVEDQEKIHTKDLTQEERISLKQQKEKEVQLTHFAVSMKSTIRFSIISNKLPQLQFQRVCMNTQSTRISFNSRPW